MGGQSSGNWMFGLEFKGLAENTNLRDSGIEATKVKTEGKQVEKQRGPRIAPCRGGASKRHLEGTTREVLEKSGKCGTSKAKGQHHSNDSYVFERPGILFIFLVLVRTILGQILTM